MAAEVDGRSLVARIVLPSRLALICRGEATLGYDPRTNIWHRIDEGSAEVLRWLRSGRPHDALSAHLERRFRLAPGEGQELLDSSLKGLLLRRLVHLDREPDDFAVRTPEMPLGVVYWITTQACNLRCTYCYQDAALARPNELTTDEAMDLVDQVVDAGVPTMVFTGGEPFVRKDVIEVALYARSRGLRTTVITNGAFINPRTVDAVGRAFELVTISLDHVKPEHHDRFRGAGSWLRAVRAIGLLERAGVPTDVNSTLTRSGLADIAELLRLRERKAIGQHKIVPRFPMGRGSTDKADELSPSELLGLSDRIAALKSEPRHEVRVEGAAVEKGLVRAHCGAGLSEVSIDPEGWVYPCRLLQHPEFRADNVRDRRLADVYGSHPALHSVRRNTTEERTPCNRCIIRKACGGGCRGIHYSFEPTTSQAHPLFCAYLRRAFEGRAWSSTGAVPVGRRADWVESRVKRHRLAIVEG